MAHEVIAIDGPAASGKSTVARRVAGELGWLYVDSGAVYRGIAWQVLRAGARPDEPMGVMRALMAARFRFFVQSGAVRFTVDGRDPGAELRSREVTECVSPVAAMAGVRVTVVGWLRQLTMHGKLVMEGRDIGTAVFPNTPYKFYLDASPEERARRRHAEVADHEVSSVDTVRAALRRRDEIDSRRKADPLKIAPDAVVIDSTAMTIEAVARSIVDRVRAARPPS